MSWWFIVFHILRLFMLMEIFRLCYWGVGRFFCLGARVSLFLNTSWYLAWLGLFFCIFILFSLYGLVHVWLCLQYEIWLITYIKLIGSLGLKVIKPKNLIMGFLNIC